MSAKIILIVDAHAFDRCLNEKNAGHKEDDWMRCELSRALEKGKNNVPVFLSGVNSIPKGLPDDISKVQYLNGLTANHEYFDEFYRRLKTFLNDDRPRGKVWLAVLAVGVLVGAIIIMYYLNKKDPMQSSITVIHETPSPDTTRLKEKDNLAVITRDTTKAKQNPRSAYVPSINISPKSIEKPKPVRADLKPEEGKLSVKKTQPHSIVFMILMILSSWQSLGMQELISHLQSIILRMQLVCLLMRRCMSMQRKR